MTDYFIRYRAAITAQASAVIAGDALSSGSKTQVSLAGAGNADGAHALQFEIDVTAAPPTEGYCEVWCEPLHHDGVGVGAPFRCARVPIQITTVADKYTCEFDGAIPEKANYIIKAIDFGFTASLSVRSKYASDT